jgi:hypothetical protein
MLTKKLAIILIAAMVLSSILAVLGSLFYEVDILVVLLLHTMIYTVIIVWFIADIYRNTQVPYRWVWIILTILAPIVLLIAYTITYIPSKSQI